MVAKIDFDTLKMYQQMRLKTEVESSRTDFEVLGLGLEAAVFFELLKFCGALEKFFGKRFFVEIA